MVYLSPDVYVKEVPSGPKPIQAVGTSTAAFIGEARRAGAPQNEAVTITTWRTFVDRFVKDPDQPDMPASTPLIQAVWGFFQNGGGRCVVVNSGAKKSLQHSLEALECEDDVAIVAAPGFSDFASYQTLVTHCENMEDRVAILDAPRVVDKLERLINVGEATERRTREKPARSGGLGPPRSKGGYAALYYPWLYIRDPLAPANTISVPPSGHVAGIYARTDGTRGVHKAPANEPVRGATGVVRKVNRAMQEILNPEGVNVIRQFATEGILVWGARTVAPVGNAEWRYVNVRRLFNMIKESIAKSTRWIVFEPNDQRLWAMIIRDVRAFLTTLWRDGALVGASADQAFFVKCDAETNPPETVDQGKVVTLIGIAPSKPAEFIIFELSQHAAGSETAI